MNKQELKSVMAKFGDTQTSLAEAIGISRTILNLKINEKNGASFTQPEISAIRDRYNLDAMGIERIFFARNVS